MKIFLLIFFMVCIVSYPAIGKELAVTGIIYTITERDALEELEERVKAVDWNKQLQSIKPTKYRPPNLSDLPRARRSRIFQVDMRYTLEHDIVNDKGELLYPKGYTFNPLDNFEYKRTLVIINGDDPEQVKWFRSSPLRNKIDVSLFITQGASFELSKSINRPVYYATLPLVARFQLKAVPSIVKAKGKNMEIEEVAIQRSKE